MQIFLEVKESLFKRKIFSVLIFLQVLLLLIFMSALFLYYSKVDIKTKSFYAQYEDMSIYQLSDNLFDKREDEYFSNINELNNLKQFYNKLQNNDGFIYLNTTLQPIGILNFRGRDIHLQGYEDGFSFPSYEKQNGTYEVVKSIQINENVLSNFELSMKEGTIFKKDNFIYKIGDNIPVILGSDYQNIYQIGDLIELDYINRTMQGKIIGILETNSTLPVKNDVDFSLDRYVLLPEFRIDHSPVNKEDTLFQQRHYLHLINGQLFSNKNKLEIRNLMNDISVATNFYDLTIIGANSLGIDLMFSMIKQNKNLLTIFTIILFFFCIISISISLIMKWNINVKKYLIHLISGATINRILCYVFTEIFGIILLSLSFIFIFMQTVGVMPNYYYLLMILVGLVITLLGMIPFYLKLKDNNLFMILKRKE